jgi:hypothetical protein
LDFENLDKIHFSTIINKNGLEPRLSDLKNYTHDSWREIRTFLGLSLDCEFVDGFIPKGWGAAGDGCARNWGWLLFLC